MSRSWTSLECTRGALDQDFPHYTAGLASVKWRSNSRGMRGAFIVKDNIVGSSTHSHVRFHMVVPSPGVHPFLSWLTALQGFTLVMVRIMIMR